jgi:hypothetical protein
MTQGTCDVCHVETEVYPILYPYVKVYRCSNCLMQKSDFKEKEKTPE